MAPLSAAIHVDCPHKLPGDVFAYHGQTDPDWTVTAVPNGGYVLGLMLQACIEHQSSTKHLDPIHVTAHFMRSAVVGEFEVHIRVLKSGRGFTNLSVQFMQQDQVRVTSHTIFGVLAAPDDSPGPKLTIEPPSPYARRIPMDTHPAKCPESAPRQKWTYKKHITVANDPVHEERAKSPRQGLEFGIYLTLDDPEERLTPPVLAFMADTYEALDEYVPGIHQTLRATSWAPTIVMTLEFKFPIPKPFSKDHSPRTVAIWSSSKFMNDPQGRHDSYVEVWTAPSNVGEGIEGDNWKEGQRCLAVSTQMALLIPMEVNQKLGGRTAKL